MKNLTNQVEKIFILSPCLWAWAVVFNFPDSKHILSRLIVFVCLYSLLVFRKELVFKFNDDGLVKYICVLLFSGIYYSYLHFFRGGHFDYARVVFAVLAYFIFVPNRFFSMKNIIFIFILSSVVFLAIAVREKLSLHIPRIGYIVNPGPYAMATGFLILVQVCIFKSLNLKMKSIVSFNIFCLLYCLLFSKTRAVWIALIICMFIFFKFE